MIWLPPTRSLSCKTVVCPHIASLSFLEIISCLNWKTHQIFCFSCFFFVLFFAFSFLKRLSWFSFKTDNTRSCLVISVIFAFIDFICIIFRFKENNQAVVTVCFVFQMMGRMLLMMILTRYSRWAWFCSFI